MSDTHAKLFFDLCKQVGGPRLLPSKPRGKSTEPSPESNGQVASVHNPSNEDVEQAEVDGTTKESQVCEGVQERSCGARNGILGVSGAISKLTREREQRTTRSQMYPKKALGKVFTCYIRVSCLFYKRAGCKNDEK